VPRGNPIDVPARAQTSVRSRFSLEVKMSPQTPNSIPLNVDMTAGKASEAKAAEGDAPVFAYIASLPQPQRGIAERIDALAAEALPGLKRAVKWGMAYYGVDEGWCFTAGAFVGHVKVMFIRGADLHPEPPIKPIAMGKNTRGIEIESITSLDAAQEAQIVSWMQQAAEMPFKTAASRKAAAR
jgi:hypothetical protein